MTSSGSSLGRLRRRLRPRRLRARAALLLAAAAAIAGVAALAAGASGPPTVLPDLAPQVPERVSVTERDGRFLLGFRSAADNVGAGPLIVDGERDVRSPQTMATTQVIRREDDSDEQRPLLVELEYVESEDHSHWHYPAFMRYELRRSDGSLVGPDRKTGFCLGDRYEVDRDERLPGEPSEPPYTDFCGEDAPDLGVLRQGISVGYGDDYDAYLEGQSIDLTEVEGGLYQLVHVVNPERSLSESDYDNNASSVLLSIARPDGIAASPEVNVLARCAGSERCPAAER